MGHAWSGQGREAIVSGSGCRCCQGIVSLLIASLTCKVRSSCSKGRKMRETRHATSFRHFQTLSAPWWLPTLSNSSSHAYFSSSYHKQGRSERLGAFSHFNLCCALSHCCQSQHSWSSSEMCLHLLPHVDTCSLINENTYIHTYTCIHTHTTI